MLAALLVFLVGCLVLAVVVYVVQLILAMIDLPPQIKQIATLIVGLICLVALIWLALSVASGGAGFTIRL